MFHRTDTLELTCWLPGLLTFAWMVLMACGRAWGQETKPVGQSLEDQQRNAVLLEGYDYGSYVEALTGYTGQDRQRVAALEYRHAVRTRVGPRGNYKAGMALLPPPAPPQAGGSNPPPAPPQAGGSKGGALVLATCRRSSENPRQFLIHVYQSADQGLTWEEIGAPPLFGKEPSLTARPDGSLVLSAQNLENPAEIQLARSLDGGRTWEPSTLPGQDYPRNMIVEPDGQLLMIRAWESGWTGGGSPHLQMCRSKDGGQTWEMSEGIVDWDYAAFGEVASVRLQDGRLLAALRRQIPGTHGEGFEDTVLTESTDNGQHWSKPRPMLNTAEVHAYLTELHDGRLLATYSNYHLPWGVYAVISPDGGQTWDPDHPIRLALSASYYVGWPVTLELPDHSLITSYAIEAYWKQPPDTTVTEVVRWSLSESPPSRISDFGLRTSDFGLPIPKTLGTLGGLAQRPAPTGTLGTSGMVGAFDWRRTIRRRPVFTVDYWPGVPGIVKEGRTDLASDLQHLLAYADPVTVRTLRGGFNADSVAPEDPGRTGVFVLPDLLHRSDDELLQWQQQLRDRLQPLLQEYRQAGVYSLDLHTFFLCSGHNDAPSWYRELPDWAECDLEGRPLDQPCLTHPQMYEVLDRAFQAMSFLRDEPVFLGFHLENEPHLGPAGDLSRYGGNPHTKAAFRQFLQAVYGSVEEFNRLAGRRQGGAALPKGFGTVDIGDSNWLVRVMAARFRSTLVTGVYQTRLAQIAKKHFPHAVTMTRLETGYWLREQDGKAEINGLDFTYLKDSPLDVISWSHLWDGRNPDGLGQLHVTGGLLRGLGKPIGFTEPHVLRYGQSQWGVFRPEELLHFLYRGLFYNFRMFNLHTWDRHGAWAIYNEPFGAVYSKHPGTLRMVAQLRAELERSAPYETFGPPVMPPLRLLVSRNARHYPGLGGWFYGNWLSRLCPILERPQFTSYEVLEEATGDVEAALPDCRGVVVADACLEPRTRQRLADFAAHGGRLLVFGAPATVGPRYEPADLPDAYPVAPLRESLAKLSEEPVPEAVDCPVVTDHPLFAGLASLRLLRPTPVEVRPGAQVAVQSPQGEAVGAASGQVVYLSGFPTESSQQRTLLTNFQRWCGVEPPVVIISQFEQATVVQNWDTANHRLDGSVIDPQPFVGSVPMHGDHQGLIQELRKDHPWLAYRRAEGGIVLEGVRVDPQDVKVFRQEAARELPHFENIPDAIGFTFFWAGGAHPIIGRFTAVREIDVDARLVGGPWNEEQIGWYVVEIGQERVAEGPGRQVRFHVVPGKDYYLTAVTTDHPQRENCPLCRDHAFE